MLTNENRNKAGRGRKRHAYTVEDIAKLAGRAEGTIYNASWSGKLNLDNLESVFQYCQKCRKKTAVK